MQEASRNDPTHSVLQPHARTWQEVAQELSTNLETGLSPQEVAKRIQEYGENELKGDEGIPIWKVFIKQVCYPEVLISIHLPSHRRQLLLHTAEEAYHVVAIGCRMLIWDLGLECYDPSLDLSDDFIIQCAGLD